MTLPVFFIPGWGQAPAVWQPLVEALGVERPSITPSLPGYEAPEHAATGTRIAYELPALVAYYAEAAPARCHVVGWSLGAQIALAWAQQRPGQTASLTLIGATPCFGERADWQAGTPTAVQAAFATQVSADPAIGFQRFGELMSMGERDPRPVRRALRTISMSAPIPPTEILLAGLRLLADTDLRASIRSGPPSQATLLVHGEQDTITPIAASRWLHENIPASTPLYLPQCGHAPMLSQPEALALAMNRLFDDAE